MKVLLDSCVYGPAAAVIREAGHDVLWAGDEKDPGDEAILAQAHKDGRVLVTLDKDFGELAVARGQDHCGIIRLVDIAAREQGRVCAHILAHHETDLAAGALITVEAGRVRIRLP